MKNSTTIDRFEMMVCRYMQREKDIVYMIMPLSIVCFSFAIASIFFVQYANFFISASVGYILYYRKKIIQNRSDNDWRKIATTYRNKEIYSDDYIWVDTCCNKHHELKDFVKKISLDGGKLKEKELRLIWIKLGKIEELMDQREYDKKMENARSLLLNTTKNED